MKISPKTDKLCVLLRLTHTDIKPQRTEFTSIIKKLKYMSELDIRKWLSNIAETVASKDLDKHMDLISENVMVYGMPSGKTLNYEDWRKRRESEFKRDLIKKLAYDNLQIKNFGLRRLIFTIQEIIDGTNKDMAIINKQVVLEQEQDQKWRVVEETIKDWKFLKGNRKN